MINQIDQFIRLATEVKEDCFDTTNIFLSFSLSFSVLSFFSTSGIYLYKGLRGS